MMEPDYYVLTVKQGDMLVTERFTIEMCDRSPSYFPSIALACEFELLEVTGMVLPSRVWTCEPFGIRRQP